MTHTICIYCGMPGAIITTVHLVAKHQYQCGTWLNADVETGEVYERDDWRSPGCREIQRLRMELAAMTNNWQRVVATQDGGHEDDPY